MRQRASQPLPLSGSAGVILGTLFASGRTAVGQSKPLQGRLSADDSSKVVLSGGRHLVHEFWGRYVALFADDAAQHVWILKSPTGGLPCYMTDVDGVLILFSLIQDCLDLHLRSFSINWAHIRARLAFGPGDAEDTALSEVRELRNGECLEFANSKSRRYFVWHPFDVIRSGGIEGVEHAATELRQVGAACVAAWASCHDSVLHRLSGGLDSSIVLGCLKQAPTSPQITCVNFYAPSWNSGDERRFARLAAARANCELVERQRSADAVSLELLCNLPPSVNPFRHLAHLEISPHERQLAADRSATAVFNGDPGDSLFCRHEMQLAVVDYVRRHGATAAFLSLAAGVAPLVGMSIWKVLKLAVRDGLITRNPEPGKGLITNRTLVHKDLMQEQSRQEQYIHPWFRPSADIPPGKLLQVRATLGYSELFYPPFCQPDDPEEISPLQSQPLVETCLRIPTYVHLYGHHDRGLARHAFAAMIPREIRTRYWKGSGGRLAQDIVKHNIVIARELLLGGVLLSDGLLDGKGLGEALSGRPTRSSSHALEIFEMLLIESWIRSWKTPAVRAVA